MNICAECKHYRVHTWPSTPIPTTFRCYKHPTRDPVTGTWMAPDCAKLNPTGECEHFEPLPPKRSWWRVLTGKP